jgi:arylsulfatase A-like enzyme
VRLRSLAPWAAAALVVACTSSGGGRTGPSRSSGPGSPPPPTSTQAASGAPNILVILTDDQRATGTLGVMPATRQLFERQGTTFTNAFVTTPLCCPSRSSILTGRYAHNTGVHTNEDALRLDQRTTVERYLHDAGYQTAIVGKFLNSWPLDRDPPFFDRWAVLDYGYGHTAWNIQGEARTVDEYSTRFIADTAVQDLRAFETRGGTPWFLYVAATAPHDPWIPQARYAQAPVPPFREDPAARERDLGDKPEWVRRSPHLPRALITETHDGQLRTLMSVDDLVARVFGTLRRLGEDRNTLAVFMSDNGFVWGEHGLAGKRAGETDFGVSRSSGKRFPYTPSIRVPFLLRWPGHVAKGATDRRLMANVDLTPTFLDAAGASPDRSAPLDGRPLLAGGARRQLFFEYYRDHQYPRVPSWASIRTRGFQYVEYFGRKDEITFREYYDLRKDPLQLRNLLHDGNPANDPDVSGLASEIRKEARCTGMSGPDACP